VFEPESAEFIARGTALLVATVSSDGEPHACRAWGADVVDTATVRILLDAADTTAIEHLASDGAVAITATDVRTLRSLQMKGRSLGLQPGTSTDGERARRYYEAFFADVVATDGSDPRLLHRLVPGGYVVCEIEVDALYDQTPGPGAGRPVEAASRG
jgi:hypothetical protein